MKTHKDSIYSNTRLDQPSGQDNGEFRWTVLMAGLGIFIGLMYVVVCLATGRPVIFYGS
jgi:hypothetical protein